MKSGFWQNLIKAFETDGFAVSASSEMAALFGHPFRQPERQISRRFASLAGHSGSTKRITGYLAHR